MASKVVALGLVAVVVAAFVAGASAQTGCTTVIISLAPCLQYMQGNSSTPSASCCSQLASVVKSQPRCLCQVLQGGTSALGISLNQTKALALPTACKVETPPASQCNSTAGPAASPTESPAPASPSTPATPSTPAASSPESPSTPSTPAASSPAAGGGSKSTPSSGGQSSGGSSNKMTLSVFFCALFLASYASTAGTF